MIKYIKGDLFTTEADIIGHGVNCVGGFASGVAAGIAHNHPKARIAYLNKHKTSKWKLGDVQFVRSQDKWIANLTTQQEYLPRGICHVDYKAVELVMKELKYFAVENNMTVAIPKIGSGLAGGDWNIIESIINEVFDNVEILVYYRE